MTDLQAKAITFVKGLYFVQHTENDIKSFQQSLRLFFKCIEIEWKYNLDHL